MTRILLVLAAFFILSTDAWYNPCSPDSGCPLFEETLETGGSATRTCPPVIRLATDVQHPAGYITREHSALKTIREALERDENRSRSRRNDPETEWYILFAILLWFLIRLKESGYCRETEWKLSRKSYIITYILHQQDNNH